MANDPPRHLPLQQAVALAYQSATGVPRVVAKGRGLIAEAIIDKARDVGVYVHESPELVSLLMQLDLDESIPPELYRAIAELLAFIHYLANEAGQTPKIPFPLPATPPA
jgi:flagellar biosynthesis protein